MRKLIYSIFQLQNYYQEKGIKQGRIIFIATQIFHITEIKILFVTIFITNLI